jgi:tryptophan-rich sensory protein
MSVQEARTTSYWRFAIPAALVIVALGSLSGYLSNSGYSNGWFEGLRKPSFMPPGWVFGVVWTTLYTLMGLAFAFVWLAWPSRLRRNALRLFHAQLLVNLAWSPIFFGGHMIDIGLVTIVILFGLVALSAWHFARIEPLAGWLLVPYLAWLCLATALNFEIGRLNPGADAMNLGLFGG